MKPTDSHNSGRDAQGTARDSSGSHKEWDGFDIQACSSMDCTGLIPALPVDEAQLDSYKDLYPYLPDED